ncbi:hypothetical protein ADL03_38810 [Nocardia sp. NRRL S-836]|nr:hypothetical protein ADL03_38810 [Nocardia sp. NRRL S-836]
MYCQPPLSDVDRLRFPGVNPFIATVCGRLSRLCRAYFSTFLPCAVSGPFFRSTIMRNSGTMAGNQKTWSAKPRPNSTTVITTSNATAAAGRPLLGLRSSSPRSTRLCRSEAISALRTTQKITATIGCPAP